MHKLLKPVIPSEISRQYFIVCRKTQIAYFDFSETRPAAPEELTHLALILFLLLVTQLRFLA